MAVLLCAVGLCAALPGPSRAQQPSGATPDEQLDYFAPASLPPANTNPTNLELNGVPREQAHPPPAGASRSLFDVRLWIEWGAGASRRWQGELRLDEGELSELQALGYAADEPGSMFLEDGRVIIRQRRARQYDSLSVLAKGRPNSILSIRLTPADDPQQVRHIRLALWQLISQVHRTSIGERGNLLIIRRAPGDRLRVLLSRDRLVFSPNESFQFRVVPHLLDAEPGAKYRLEVKLLQARTDHPLWTTEQRLRARPDGQLAGLAPISIQLPGEQGVYDIRISLGRRRFFSSSKGQRAGWPYQRKLQLVVVDAAPALPSSFPPSSAEGRSIQWRLVDQIDPAKPGPDERQPGAAGPPRRSRSGPSSRGGQPLANGGTQASRPDRAFVQLPPGGWQAYPLEVRTPNRPHLLEVQYASDLRQTLGISIVEPDAAGQVAPLGLDSGVYVSGGQPGGRRPAATHRLIFWPRTKRPVLLLTNQDKTNRAVYGPIRLLSGPARLPERTGLSSGQGRLLAVYYDQPLFPENFSASGTLDRASGRVLKDWLTFYQGGQRLVQYLKHVGYNGAMIAVARDGGTIYPSRLLQPTPRFDNGVFFTTAQDPFQKDVLEMLLRMFDHAGLKLVPAVRFSAPLPELEKLRRRRAAGIELVGADGQSWVQRNGAPRGVGPYYNPLDPTVQQAMKKVIRELAERYAHHPALAGIALQLGPDTYAQLPDDEWGCDDQTLSRFAEQAEIGRAAASWPAARHNDGDLLQRWLSWRAAVLAEWYRELQREIAQAKPGAKLYLAAADMFNGPQVQQAFRAQPVGHDPSATLADLMLRMGIDPECCRHAGIVLLRPERVEPSRQGAIDLELACAVAKDKIFAAGGSRAAGLASGTSGRHDVPSQAGALFYHGPRRLALPSLDSARPADAHSAGMRLASHLSPAGLENRRRFVHSLAALDAQSIFDGGWMAMLGQEDALGDLVDLYRWLPAQQFETVFPTGVGLWPAAGRRAAEPLAPSANPPRQASGYLTTQPIVVRRLSWAGQTLLYLANDSPWPVAVSLELPPGSYHLASLSDRPLPGLAERNNLRYWTVPLEPYDLVAARLSAPDLKVTDWRAEVGPEVVAQLRRGLEDLRARIEQQRGRPLPVLVNPGFEMSAQAGQLAGWQHGIGKGMRVAVDPRQSHRGNNSLRLESVRPPNWPKGPTVWLRSEPFEPPNSRRLAVCVWLRTRDERAQPSVRIVVEGRLADQRFQRQLELGRAARFGNASLRLKETWAPFLMAINDLPPEGLRELRVGLDLRDTGVVWIDDVQVLDVFLTDPERRQLLRRVDAALADLETGRLGDCRRFLDSYAAQLLRCQVPVNPVVRPRFASQGSIVVRPTRAGPDQLNGPLHDRPIVTARAGPPRPVVVRPSPAGSVRLSEPTRASGRPPATRPALRRLPSVDPPRSQVPHMAAFPSAPTSRLRQKHATPPIDGAKAQQPSGAGLWSLLHHILQEPKPPKGRNSLLGALKAKWVNKPARDRRR